MGIIYYKGKCCQLAREDKDAAGFGVEAHFFWGGGEEEKEISKRDASISHAHLFLAAI